jgi:TPR repeat protein
VESGRLITYQTHELIGDWHPLQSDEILAGQAIEAHAYDEAVRLLRPLAERNSEYALLTLGWIYETGATGTPNKDAARSFYEHAASQGSATACLYLGWLLSKEGDEETARTAFERGVDLGNDECKSELARLSDWANEKAAERAMEEQRYKDAVRLLRPLGERNSLYALRCLAYIYETGVTGPPDLKAARSHYERAASHGQSKDYYELGHFLSAEGDDTLARAAYKAGAEQGHVPSMGQLGRMMVKGRGGPVDVQDGFDWIEKAVKEHTSAERAELTAEEKKARSVFAKAVVKAKIALLWFRGLREVVKGLPNKIG